MTKLQKRAKPEALYLPVALQAGVSPASSPPLPSTSEYPISKPTFTTPLSPFQKTHRRAASTPRTPQTQWPLIATSSPPSVAYPMSPHHDPANCSANCTLCGKKRLIQLNSPPSAHIPNRAAPLRPIPQAHMRAVSEGVITKPNRLGMSTTPGKPPCCQKCGRHKRPASLPVQSSSKQAKIQIPPMPQGHMHSNYSRLRPSTNTSTPHPNALPSRPPSPPSPSHFYPSDRDRSHEHIISPLTPRRKVDFAFPLPNKSSSGASNTPYSPISQSDNEIPEIGTGRLINLISNAIRESSPPLGAAQKYEAVKGHSRNTSLEAVVGLGLTETTSTTNLISTSTSTSHPTSDTHHLNARSPLSLSAPNIFHPIELDSTPLDSTTHDILSAYSTNTHANEDAYAEYTHDWTDALSIPVIRLPSVKEGITRFKSLRGGGRQSSSSGTNGVGRSPSVRERFGSLRGNGSGMQGGWYGRVGPEAGSGGRYQSLGSSVEVGVY